MQESQMKHSQVQYNISYLLKLIIYTLNFPLCYKRQRKATCTSSEKRLEIRFKAYLLLVENSSKRFSKQLFSLSFVIQIPLILDCSVEKEGAIGVLTLLKEN